MALRTSQMVYVGSFVLHATAAVALNAIKTPPPKDIVVGEMQTLEQEKKEKPKPPEPAPPAPAPRAPHRAAPPPEAAPEAPPPAPDFGFVMGAADGPGGIAIAPPEAKAAPVRQATKKLDSKAAVQTDTCAEAEVKAKATNMPRPAYTEDARAAAIEGKVRVELTLDASGKVTDAKIIEGLGHGLDEAAIEALRGATFTPATRCGVATGSTFTVAVRFTL